MSHSNRPTQNKETASFSSEKDEIKIQSPDSPGSIKKHEESRINPAFTILGENHFVPVEGVTYLWIYTEEKKIILGIEHITNDSNFKALNAYENKSSSDAVMLKLMRDENSRIEDEAKRFVLADMKKTSESELDVIQKKKFDEAVKHRIRYLGTGHPTLAVHFDEQGNVLPSKAFIAGELEFVDGTWQINNRSGRFYHIQSDKKAINQLISHVAQQLKKHTNLEYKINIINKSPHETWQKLLKKEPDLTYFERGLYLILKLFKYSLPGGKGSPAFERLKRNILTAENIRRELRLDSTIALTLNHVIDYCSSAAFRTAFSVNLSADVLQNITNKLPDYLRELASHVEEEKKAATPNVANVIQHTLLGDTSSTTNDNEKKDKPKASESAKRII